MHYLGGVVKPEVDWNFLLCAQQEMYRVMRTLFFAAQYSNRVGMESERDFMVMYLMGGEI